MDPLYSAKFSMLSSLCSSSVLHGDEVILLVLWTHCFHAKRTTNKPPALNFVLCIFHFL